MKKTDNNRFLQTPKVNVREYMICQVLHPDEKSLRNQVDNLLEKILQIGQRKDSAPLAELRKHVNEVRSKSN